MIYYIDFDGTICPNDISQPPPPACIELLRELRRRNHTIVIYSCRSNNKVVEDAAAATQEMQEYLKDYGVIYDSIQSGKPLFNYIIDDRAVGIPKTPEHIVDWEEVAKIIRREKLY